MRSDKTPSDDPAMLYSDTPSGAGSDFSNIAQDDRGCYRCAVVTPVCHSSGQLEALERHLAAEVIDVMFVNEDGSEQIRLSDKEKQILAEQYGPDVWPIILEGLQ